MVELKQRPEGTGTLWGREECKECHANLENKKEIWHKIVSCQQFVILLGHVLGMLCTC